MLFIIVWNLLPSVRLGDQKIYVKQICIFIFFIDRLHSTFVFASFKWRQSKFFPYPYRKSSDWRRLCFFALPYCFHPKEKLLSPELTFTFCFHPAGLFNWFHPAIFLCPHLALFTYCSHPAWLLLLLSPGKDDWIIERFFLARLLHLCHDL